MEEKQEYILVRSHLWTLIDQAHPRTKTSPEIDVSGEKLRQKIAAFHMTLCVLIGHAKRPDVHLNQLTHNVILPVRWMSVTCAIEQLSLVVRNTAPSTNICSKQVHKTVNR